MDDGNHHLMTTAERPLPVGKVVFLCDPETNLFPRAVPIKRQVIREPVVGTLFQLCSEIG
ncbi:MAG: hypothetical protein ACYSR1_05675 [Planctomycetota bacterium]